MAVKLAVNRGDRSFSALPAIVAQGGSDHLLQKHGLSPHSAESAERLIARSSSEDDVVPMAEFLFGLFCFERQRTRYPTCTGYMYPVKRHRGSRDTHGTNGTRGRTKALGPHRRTHEPHNHPNPPTTHTPHVSATTEAAAGSAGTMCPGGRFGWEGEVGIFVITCLNAQPRVKFGWEPREGGKSIITCLNVRPS